MKRDSNTAVQFANNEKDSQNGNGTHSNGSSVQVHTISAPNREESQNSQQQIRSVISAFRRRWFSSLTLGILFGGLAAAATWQLVPAPFTASAELRINTMQDRLVFQEVQFSDFDTYKQTLSRIVKSPFVINSALDQVSKSDLEIVPETENRVQWLESNLKVSSPAKEFLQIKLSGEHPKKLKVVLKAIVDSFLRSIENETKDKTKNLLTELRKLRNDSKSNLEGLNSRLKQLATASKSANNAQLNDTKKYQLDLKLALQVNLGQVQLELFKLKRRLNYNDKNPLKTSDLSIPDSILLNAVLQHPDYLKEKQKNRGLEDQAENWKETVGEKHSRFFAAIAKFEESNKKLEKLKVDLKEEVKAMLIEETMATKDLNVLSAQEEIRVFEAEMEGIKLQIDKLTDDDLVIGKNTFEMQKIQKDIAKEEALEKKFDDRITSLTTESDRDSLVKVHREAAVPSKRDVGKKMKLSSVAGFGGFAFVLCGIVFLEYRFRRISSIEEVSDKLSMRVLGTLPLMPRSVTKQSGKSNNSRSAFWHSALTESIDATRTMLLRESDLESMNVVMIASAMGGEGKTTLACHLSTSMARAGRKTILVDCDLRRPNVSKVYDVGVTPGICEILRGEAKLEDCIRELSDGILSILPAGKINQEVLGLLAQNEIGEIFQVLKKEYDFVIVDSSPILPVTDSLLIAQHVDAVMFSIRRDVSRMAKVGAAVQKMSMLGIPFLGAVAIGLDDESFGFNYPYKYQYGYGYGYRNAYLGYPSSRS